jgi:cyanophycin synthetase
MGVLGLFVFFIVVLIMLVMVFVLRKRKTKIPQQSSKNNGQFDIVLGEYRFIRGPNQWTYVSVLEMEVDIGELEEWPSDRFPGMADRLRQLLPGLHKHRCSIGKEGGFLTRVRNGTWMGHIMEHVALELGGREDGFGRTREMGKKGQYHVVIDTHHENFGIACMEEARALVLSIVNNKDDVDKFDVDESKKRIEQRMDKYGQVTFTNKAIMTEALERYNIPSFRLSENNNLIQFGHGIHQKRLWFSHTHHTKSIANDIAVDKELTKKMISGIVPIAEGITTSSVQEAWEFAKDRLPVVIKPADSSNGHFIYTNLSTEKEVTTIASMILNRGYKALMVERFIRGKDHRVLVLNRKVVAVLSGEEAAVTGDGKSTVEELVKNQLNNDPRFNKPPIDFDSKIRPQELYNLRRNGLEPTSILAKNRRLVIRTSKNEHLDTLDKIHPDTVSRIVMAVDMIGLDLAGVDVVAEDISKPLKEQKGAVMEINSRPSIDIHILFPAKNRPPIQRDIVQHLFSGSGRIPIIGVLGHMSIFFQAWITDLLLRTKHKSVGIASHRSLMMNHQQIEKVDARNFDVARRLLLHPFCDAAIMETSLENILEDGLPYDRCQIAVIPSAPTDPEKLKVVRTQVDVVLPRGVAVLNAEGSHDLAQYCDGEVILYTSTMPGNAAFQEHVRQGGRGVARSSENKSIVFLSNHGRDTQHVDIKNVFKDHLQELPMTMAVSWALLPLPSFLPHLQNPTSLLIV